jgi:hypothetical protein
MLDNGREQLASQRTVVGDAESTAWAQRGSNLSFLPSQRALRFVPTARRDDPTGISRLARASIPQRVLRSLCRSGSYSHVELWALSKRPRSEGLRFH